MKQLIIFLITICIAGCFGADPQKTGLEGKPIPAFKFLLTDSITWINNQNMPNNKPIVFFYFSPYCPYCKDQTQEIIEEIDELKNIQFYFISNFPLQTLKAYSKEYELSKYSNIIIGQDSVHLVGDYFKIKGVPFMAIYSKDKILNKSFMGKIFSTQIKQVAED